MKNSIFSKKCSLKIRKILRRIKVNSLNFLNNTLIEKEDLRGLFVHQFYYLLLKEICILNTSSQ